jgi:peroxiredoxin
MLNTNLIPDFTLDSSEGIEVRASDYRGKRNLVLAFLGTVPPAAMEWLNALAQHTDDLEEENARVLIIVQDMPAQVRDLHAELGAPFIFLADCAGEVSRRFALHETPVPKIYSIHRDTLPNPAEIIASLRHINIMCDE